MESGLNKLYWGFLFIMLGFRIQGFDILPDIVGYILFASAFSDLASENINFSIAAKYNIPMIILSVFSIYQSPVQGQSINFGSFGLISIVMGIATFILNLLIVYNLFLGIKSMAEQRGQFDLASESDERWNQYKLLQIAVLFTFILIFIPPLAFIYILVIFVVSIIIVIKIMGFIKICKESLIA